MLYVLLVGLIGALCYVRHARKARSDRAKLGYYSPYDADAVGRRKSRYERESPWHSDRDHWFI